MRLIAVVGMPFFGACAGAQAAASRPARPLAGRRRPRKIAPGETNNDGHFHTTMAPPPTTREHMAQIVKECRERLRPWVLMGKYPRGCWQHLVSRFQNRGDDIMNKVYDLGDYDGIGALVKAAAVHLERDGTIGASEAQRFLVEGETIMQDIQANALNFTVLFSLLLTISFSLISLGVGNRQYPDANNQFDAFGGSDDEGSAAFSKDLASYCYPDDYDGQIYMRRCFYAAEMGLLCVAAIVQTLGLFESFNLCVAFGGALPSLCSKYDFLLERPQRMTTLYFVFVMGLLGPLAALPFISARVSALASLGTFGVVGSFFFCMLWTQYSSTVNAIWAMQHREACRALANADREQEVEEEEEEDQDAVAPFEADTPEAEVEQ